MKNNDDIIKDFFLPRTSASDLRGKQSVRATFKLTEKAIGALNIVSYHLGIKQKSLFDHLMEDIESLQTIAMNIHTNGFNRRECVQKTYVLSRKTLSSLDKASKNYDAPRDALVEYSIQRLLPIIEREKKKHFKRKEIIEEMSVQLDNKKKLLNKAKRLLGAEDPVSERLEALVNAYENTYRSLELFVEKGKVIESF